MSAHKKQLMLRKHFYPFILALMSLMLLNTHSFALPITSRSEDKKTMSLTTYLVKKGVLLDCSFTIERQIPREGGEYSPLFSSEISDVDSVNSIEDLISQLRKELPGVEIRQDLQVQNVIHLIDETLANDPTYALNRLANVSESTTLRRFIISNESTWNLKSDWEYATGYLNVKDGIQTVTPIEDPALNVQRMTIPAIDLQDKTVRQVLTSYAPLSEMGRVLWTVTRNPRLKFPTIKVYPRSPLLSLNRGIMVRLLGLPSEPQPFSTGELAYEVNPHEARFENRAISFIARNGQQPQSHQLRWAMFYLGRYKVERAVPTLLRSIDYRYTQSALMQERFPALRALSEIGEPAALAALHDLRSETDSLRLELLARVVLAVDGNEKGKARIESLLAQLPNANHVAKARIGLDKALSS